MPRPNALVDEIRQLSRPTPIAALPGDSRLSGRYAIVAFAGGRTARLDLAGPRASGWLSALETMRSECLAAYVEIDPESSLITELLCPIAVTVVELRADDDEVDVELAISHTRHQLRRDNPDFDQLLYALEQALADATPVLVTETLDEHAIIDVRPLPKVLRSARTEGLVGGEAVCVVADARR